MTLQLHNAWTTPLRQSAANGCCKALYYYCYYRHYDLQPPGGGMR